MTYQDIVQTPQIQAFSEPYRSQKLHFSGYINFAISKALERAGTDGQEKVVDIAVQILEEELRRFAAEKEKKTSAPANNWFGMRRAR
jgi:hypothetical protein